MNFNNDSSIGRRLLNFACSDPLDRDVSSRTTRYRILKKQRAGQDAAAAAEVTSFYVDTESAELDSNQSLELETLTCYYDLSLSLSPVAPNEPEMHCSDIDLLHAARDTTVEVEGTRTIPLSLKESNALKIAEKK